MKYRRVKAVLLILVIIVAGPAQRGNGQAPLAQIGLPGENSGTARRLAAVDPLIAEKKWSEAVEEILRTLNEAGDDLVLIDGRHSVEARRLCHIRLAGLPENALGIYRERVDGQAKKWWEQGEPKNEVALLRQIVNEAFCSTFADRALDLLGDLAFERGDFAEAEYWWGLLVLPASKTVLSQSRTLRPRPLDLKYPDPKVDVARVRAKQILVQLFRGKRAEMDGEIQAFRSLHPEAEGSFAGRTGKFADILQSLKQEPGYGDFPIDQPSWPTFAGHPSRQSLIPKSPSAYLVETAVIPLDPAPPAKTPPSKLLTPSQETQTLVYYPVIDGGQVVLTNGNRVNSYDARSGNVVGHYELAEDVQQGRGDIEVGTIGGFCHSVTVTGDSIFVRLGKPAVADGKIQEKNWGTCFLVCLDRKPGKGGKLQRRWWVKAPGEGKDRVSFEGAPLVVDGRVYITRIRITGTQVFTAIECYNGASGFRFWRQEVSEIRELADGQPRSHHHLLTQAGPNIVYCSHSGAVIAVDALTGRRVWAIRYPSRGIKTADGSRSPRDLAPCVFADHKIFIAPADYDRILCVEAATGEFCWQGPPLEVVHLLGVAKGKLIFSTGPSTAAIFSPQSFYGIQAVDAETGKLLRGWMQPADGTRLATFGRGFLTKDKVYWPTEHGLRILKTEDSQPDWDDHPFNIRLGDRPGNMAFGEGILALAGAKELRIFIPAPPGLGQVRRKSSDQRESSLPAFREELQRQPWIWGGPPIGNNGGKLGNDDFRTPAGKKRPNIAVPLEESWEINLEQNEQMLVPETCQCHEGNEVFFGRGNELVCRDAHTGTMRWQQFLTGSAQWIGRPADCVLVAGFWGMQCLTIPEGKIRWKFLVPEEKGNFFLEDPQNHERRFARPRLAGSRIFFLNQEKQLFALDLETGRCLWTISAPAAEMRLPYPAGRFLPLFHPGKERVIIQTTTGKTRILQTNTGQILGDKEHVDRLWSRPPQVLDAQRICLVSGVDQVALFDGLAGKNAWVRQTGQPSVTMEPPQVFWDGSNLCLVVDGWQLERLDPETGKTLWIGTTENEPVGSCQFAFANEAIYYATRKGVHARRITDGRALWVLPLEPLSCPWRFLLLGQHLLAFPSEIPRKGHWSPVYGKPSLSFPFFAPQAMPFPFMVQLRDFPVVICQLPDGKIVQEMRLTAEGLRAGVQIIDQGVVVGAGNRAWGFRGKSRAGVEK